MSPETVCQFESVKISHDITHRIDFCYLAEFFRFIGIFVCEEIFVERQEKSEIERKTQYSACICIGDRKIDENQARELCLSVSEYDELIRNMPKQTIFLYELDSWNSERYEEDNNFLGKVLLYNQYVKKKKGILKDLLSKVIGVALESAVAGEAAANEIEALIDIYVEYEICFHSMNLQYYHKRPSSAVAEAKQAFLKGHAAVKEALQEVGENEGKYLYQYAQLWCEVKTNDACSYNREILYFIQEKIARRCRELCEQNPEFCNAKVLLGLSYEPSVISINEALWAFHDALQGKRKECFFANIYYWMGRRYESFRNMKREAEKCYRFAEKCKTKFRTTFKLAVLERDKQEFENAINLFGKILANLHLKEDLQYVDPLELDYMFKSYTQQCYIYNKMERYMEAIEVGKKAIRVRKHAIDKNRYFEEFYAKGSWDRYRRILKERMNLSTVYWLLVDSCKKIFDEGQAEKYREDALKFERELETNGIGEKRVKAWGVRELKLF